MSDWAVGEEWRALNWLVGYEISESGLLRRVSVRQKRPGSLVRGHLVRGYHLYRVTDGKGGIRRLLAHRLVCEAWHGKPDLLRREAAHWDGVRTNNHYSNLRWASPAENNADRRRHGTQAGELQSRAILKWETVRRIRAGYSGKWGEITALARQHGVKKETMRELIRGRTWKERDSFLDSMKRKVRV